jgi:hypothetical protein
MGPSLFLCLQNEVFDEVKRHAASLRDSALGILQPFYCS